jgi:hypothetical protein
MCFSINLEDQTPWRNRVAYKVVDVRTPHSAWPISASGIHHGERVMLDSEYNSSNHWVPGVTVKAKLKLNNGKTAKKLRYCTGKHPNSTMCNALAGVYVYKTLTRAKASCSSAQLIIQVQVDPDDFLYHGHKRIGPASVWGVGGNFSDNRRVGTYKKVRFPEDFKCWSRRINGEWYADEFVAY